MYLGSGCSEAVGGQASLLSAVAVVAGTNLAEEGGEASGGGGGWVQWEGGTRRAA